MSRNRYGVDTQYFTLWFDRSLRELENYKPGELARELARMSRTADSSVLLEKEFCGDIQANKVYQQERIEKLETALTESTQKLEKACSVLERANALTETQARIIRRLVDENLEESK